MRLVGKYRSADRSVKYVWEVPGEGQIETVLFDLPRRSVRRAVGDAGAHPAHLPANFVACVSSQVGCNVGCRFCATGLQRSRYDLSAAEIRSQVTRALDDVRAGGDEDALLSVTFAGMGEPLLNADNVIAAGTELLAGRLVTTVSISTVGIVPAIKRLAEEAADFILFLSLNATTDEVRRQLMPINEKYRISEIVRACREHAERVRRRTVVSYLLFAGVNDLDEDILRLESLLDPDYFNIQVLMWNEVADLAFERVGDERAGEFAERLRDAGFTAYVTASRGRDVGAGCGQLVTHRP